MKSTLQQSKLRLTSVPLTEIGCNSSDLMELRARKRREKPYKRSTTQEDLEDNEREKNANMLFEIYLENRIKILH